MASDVLTSDQAAQYLQLGLSTLKRLAREHRIPAAKAGRQWRFRKADLDRWLGRGGTAASDTRDAAPPSDTNAEVSEEEFLARARPVLELLGYQGEELERAVAELLDERERIRRDPRPFAEQFDELCESIREGAESQGYTVDDVPRIIEEVRRERALREAATHVAA